MSDSIPAADKSEHIDISVSEPVAEPVSKPKKPVTIPAARNAVVSGGDFDEVLSSRMIRADRTHAQKSLSVHHLQRRLMELGYGEAYADRDGSLGALTQSSVSAWQKDNGQEVTGLPTGAQLQSIFEGDHNVKVVLDN